MLTLDFLTAWAGQILWPFFRIAGFIMVAPINGYKNYAKKVEAYVGATYYIIGCAIAYI